jgi:hypothetical protein
VKNAIIEIIIIKKIYEKYNKKRIWGCGGASICRKQRLLEAHVSYGMTCLIEQLV